MLFKGGTYISIKNFILNCYYKAGSPHVEFSALPVRLIKHSIFYAYMLADLCDFYN